MSKLEQVSQFEEPIRLAGEVAEMLSFNRSIGQLYGFLYFSGEHLSLQEIAHACHMSKGNASIHLRTLEAWGAVHRSWKPGTRKDYYSANIDLRGLALKRIQEGFGRRLEGIRKKLDDLKANPTTTPKGLSEKRLQNVEAILKEAETGFRLLPKLLKLRGLL